MRFRRLQGPMVVMAVCALGAIGATPAAAYRNPRFEVAIGGLYAIKGGQVALETTGAYTVRCASVIGEGKILGVTTYRSNATELKFKNCISNLLAKCTSEGAKEGEIVARQPMEWDLAVLNEEREEAGLVMNENPLKPEGGQPFAAYKCGTKSYTLSGSVLGKITPVNGRYEALNKFTIETTGSKGVPGLSKYYWEPESETEKRIEGTTSLHLSGAYNGVADLTVSKLEMDVESTIILLQ